MMFPDYSRSLLSVTSAVTGFYGMNTDYPPLDEILGALKKQRTRNLILWLFDGMGANLLKQHLPEDSFLRTHLLTTVTTVCPATTTAATTSLWTGLSPLEHGWLGWSLYFKELGRTIDTFLDRDSFTGERYPHFSPANRLMPYKTVYPKLSEFAETHAFFPFPSTAMKGADFEHVYASRASMTETVKKLISSGCEKVIFIYDAEPDHTMHECGVSSEKTKAAFERANAAAKSLAASLPEDTALIITADHGLVDAAEEVPISEIPDLSECLLMPPFVEGRAASFFVKAHRKEDFKNTFLSLFSNDFLLLSREEIFEKKLLGRGTPHRKTDDFVGDFMAFATGRKYIRYVTPASGSFRLIGQHAGLTEDEMLIPVIFARGQQKY